MRIMALDFAKEQAVPYREAQERARTDSWTGDAKLCRFKRAERYPDPHWLVVGSQ